MSVTAWRIFQEKYLQTAFSGEGAKLYPGRWNERGTPMVYTASSLSLAALELLVNISFDALQNRYFTIPFEIDEKLLQEPDFELPADWASNPASASTQALGTKWITSGASVALRVPSSVIPIEHNYLLNPRHPEFSQIKIGQPQRFAMDPRLTKGKVGK